jgi:hypothetical protein
MRALGFLFAALSGLSFGAAPAVAQEVPVLVQADGVAPGSCKPTLQIRGHGCIGTTLDLLLCAPRGCMVCLWISQDPGPTRVWSYLLPIGTPTIAVFESQIPEEGCIAMWLKIPLDPGLVGKQVCYFAFGFSPFGEFNPEFGPSGCITFCERPGQHGP